jgi:outer membrane murein-binding lipoprotein Lpp
VRDHATKPSTSSTDDRSTTGDATFRDKTNTIDELPQELLGVMRCLNSSMTAMHAGTARLDAKTDRIDSNLKQIEANVDRIVASAEAYRSEFHAFRLKQEAANVMLFKGLYQVCCALGLGFKVFNAAWLQRLLAARATPMQM